MILLSILASGFVLTSTLTLLLDGFLIYFLNNGDAIGDEFPEYMKADISGSLFFLTIVIGVFSDMKADISCLFWRLRLFMI